VLFRSQYGTDTGSLGLPNGLAMAADDSLWVADAGNHRVLGYPPVFGAATEPLTTMRPIPQVMLTWSRRLPVGSRGSRRNHRFHRLHRLPF